MTAQEISLEESFYWHTIQNFADLLQENPKQLAIDLIGDLFDKKNPHNTEVFMKAFIKAYTNQ